ncbi:MAG: tetratricopeptide repeat protein [Planctomycetales bacterium]|nr:tetratricopeptide repeat protein [Planctomycetales bacterium]
MWPLAIVVGIAAVVAGGIGTILWIQDRPLRQAEELLESGLQARTQALIDGTTASDDEIKRSYHIVTEYLERFPNSSQGLALQARILVHMERPEEALRLFSEAQAATPAELQDQARAHMMLGNFDSALPIIQQVLAMEPQNEDAIYELTTCRIQLGLFQEALESAKQFTQLPDNAARGHLLQATVHGELGNAVAEVEELEKALELDPDAKRLRTNPADLFYTYGSGLLEVGRAEDALVAFNRSLELGRNPNTYVAVGNAQVELGHPELAERAWRQALEIAADHPAAREKLAQVAIENEQPRDAIDLLLPLTESDFVSSSTSFLLQRAYALAGDEEKAKEWSEYTAEIRKRENLMNVVNSVLRSAPTSMWGRAIRAHMALSFQRYEDAEQLVATLPAEAQQQPFIARLVEAVEEHNPEKLPRFDELPVDLYQ